MAKKLFSSPSYCTCTQIQNSACNNIQIFFYPRLHDIQRLIYWSSKSRCKCMKNLKAPNFLLTVLLKQCLYFKEDEMFMRNNFQNGSIYWVVRADIPHGCHLAGCMIDIFDFNLDDFWLFLYWKLLIDAIFLELKWVCTKHSKKILINLP